MYASAFMTSSPSLADVKQRYRKEIDPLGASSLVATTTASDSCEPTSSDLVACDNFVRNIHVPGALYSVIRESD